MNVPHALLHKDVELPLGEVLSSKAVDISGLLLIQELLAAKGHLRMTRSTQEETKSKWTWSKWGFHFRDLGASTHTQRHTPFLFESIDELNGRSNGLIDERPFLAMLSGKASSVAPLFRWRK